MADATVPPRRMRYWFESRCRAVQLMEQGMHPAEAAARVGASRATGYRWWERYGEAGREGLRDRPCTPHHQPRRRPPEVEAEILAVRERTTAGPRVVGAILDRAAPISRSLAPRGRV